MWFELFDKHLSSIIECHAGLDLASATIEIKDAAELVASAGIEPASGASEALILSIVLRGQTYQPKPLHTIPVRLPSAGGHCTTGPIGQNYRKKFWADQVSNCSSVFLDVNFFSSQSEKITHARAKQKPAITSDA